ncbi:UNVERIFIED_CONTAM: hypothetical protein FKN15_075503 [Acipenser sinensis]
MAVLATCKAWGPGSAGREGPRIDPGDVPAGVPPVPENKPLTKEKEGAASSQVSRVNLLRFLGMSN